MHQEVVIPPAVYEEVVVRGSEKGLSDADEVERAVGEGWIKVRHVESKRLDRVLAAERGFGVELGIGEREALALALEPDVDLLLTDDETAYQVGRTLDLECRGVLYVLLRFVGEGYIKASEARRALSRMIEDGFWLSPRIVASFNEALEKLSGNRIDQP